MRAVVLASLLLLLPVLGLAQTRMATLAWDAPTTHIDGSPLADLATYRLYSATTPGGQTIGQQPFIEVPGTQTQADVPTQYDWYWVVTAVKSTGAESAPSNEVQIADDRVPGSPGSLRVIQMRETTRIEEERTRTVLYAP